MKNIKRVLLKLSGESLAGDDKQGLNPKKLKEYAEQLKSFSKQGIEIGLVIGGGNIFRGLSGEGLGFDRVKGDYMGMLATVINGLALQSTLEAVGCPAELFTAFSTEPAGLRYSKDKAVKALKASKITIFAGGTGNPFFTTDSAAALRAVEIKADLLLKGTRVDGIYTADPEKDPKAKKYEEISFDEVISKELKIMDLTAFTMCKENNLPIYVFDMDRPGNLMKIAKGENIGSLVKN
ncbi:MAG: UMP kinase [Bacteroidota bacterium]|nr:UMP kinase [Bacteroidota bacterium]